MAEFVAPRNRPSIYGTGSHRKIDGYTGPAGANLEDKLARTAEWEARSRERQRDHNRTVRRFGSAEE